MADHGPYETSQQAHADAVAAFPGAGTILSRAQNRILLGRALEAAGVECGRYDDRIAEWLSGLEDFTVQVIAGWVRRAYKAGKAAGPEGAVTEWGVRREGEAEPFTSGPAEDAVRRFAAALPLAAVTVVRRQAGPWEEVPDA